MPCSLSQCFAVTSLSIPSLHWKIDAWQGCRVPSMEDVAACPRQDLLPLDSINALLLAGATSLARSSMSHSMSFLPDSMPAGPFSKLCPARCHGCSCSLYDSLSLALSIWSMQSMCHFTHCMAFSWAQHFTVERSKHVELWHFELVTAGG